MKSRQWSFVVTDKKYINLIVFLISLSGFFLSFRCADPTYFSRMGNFIIVLGLWISMRFTLREGNNRFKNHLDEGPVLPGSGPLVQVNTNYFNKITYSIGDARLQLHGLYITIFGALVGSFGDLILKSLFPKCF